MSRFYLDLSLHILLPDIQCVHLNVQCCGHNLFSEIKKDSLFKLYHCKSSEQMQYVE